MKKNKPPVAKRAIRTPNGIIRRGQRRPFRKGTRKEVLDRTEWLALKISIDPRLKDSELKKMLKERFDLSWQMCIDYISRAKNLLRVRANITKEHARNISVVALLDTIQNGEGAVRTGAIRLWTEIFGNAAPTQHRIGDPDGKPLATAVIAPTVQFILPPKEQLKVLPSEEDNKLIAKNGQENKIEGNGK